MSQHESKGNFVFLKKSNSASRREFIDSFGATISYFTPLPCYTSVENFLQTYPVLQAEWGPVGMCWS